MSESTPPRRRSSWRWLWLLAPAFEVLLVTAMLEVSSRFSEGYSSGGGIFVALLNLFVALLFCIGLGFWWAGVFTRDGVKQVGLGLLLAIAVVAVNTAIAYAGCAAL